MKVSVIVPCYNVETLIEPLLRSLEEQVFQDFEVIFIDDGSIDSTCGVVEQFCSADRSRYKQIKKPNGGVSSARNVGLDNAGGEYVIFLDSDDHIYPQTLAVLVELMRDDVCFAIGAFASTDGVNRFPKIENLDLWLRKTMPLGLYLWNKMFRRSTIEQNNIRFNEGLTRSEDMLFVAKYMACCNGNVAVTDYVVYFYEENPNSATNREWTTGKFLPSSIDSVRGEVQAYNILKKRMSCPTLWTIKYDIFDRRYHVLRRRARLLHCEDKAFYAALDKELHSIMSNVEIMVLAIYRRVRSWCESFKKLILRVLRLLRVIRVQS